MEWLWLALLAPLFFSATNFIEKYMLSRIAANSSAGALTILAGIAGLPFFIIFAFIAREPIAAFSLVNSIGAITVGLLVIGAFYFYYKALLLADTSIVATLFQLIIVSNYFLGLIFLGEQLTLIQIISICLILVGSVALLIEFSEGQASFNKKVFMLMALSSLLISFSSVLFKLIALDSSYLPTQFFEYSAGIIAGILLFLFSAKARSGFMVMLHKYKYSSIGLSQANELLNLGGIVAMRYAMLLAPIAVVQAVMSVQAIYLILIGAVLTVFFPKVVKENITRRHLFQKILAVLVIIAGTIILAFE